MAGETGKIAEIAEKLSQELFGEFFWARTGPMNKNWSCENQDKHNVATHPSDVVFYYDDPYSRERIYINCDLKSYAKSSITAHALTHAVISLSKQIACAEVSEEWRRLYVHQNVTPSICGLLFVYNHDGLYDKDFSSHLSRLAESNLDIPKGSKIIIFGPADVLWLDNVRYDIVLMRGQGNLPRAEYCRYFYPQLTRRVNQELGHAKAATLEMLTSSLIALEYFQQGSAQRQGILLYYRGQGETADEFTYIFDYLRHFQLLKEGVQIEVRQLNASEFAYPMFQKAQQDFVHKLTADGPKPPLANLIEMIKYKKIQAVVSQFSDIDLGME